MTLDPAEAGDEKAVGSARLGEQAGEDADPVAPDRDGGGKLARLDMVGLEIAASGEERLDYRLAFLGLERADRIDQGPAGLQPAGGPGEHRLLALGELGDRARADAVEDVGVAAVDAGGGARRVEQDGVHLIRRRPA